MGPEAVSSYNHYYWGWYNWHFTKIYPNQAYWKQQHTNYLNSWVSGMGPDGVLQPKPPKQKTGIAAWSLKPPKFPKIDLLSGLLMVAAAAVATYVAIVTLPITGALASLGMTSTSMGILAAGVSGGVGMMTWTLIAGLNDGNTPSEIMTDIWQRAGFVTVLYAAAILLTPLAWGGIIDLAITTAPVIDPVVNAFL